MKRSLLMLIISGCLVYMSSCSRSAGTQGLAQKFRDDSIRNFIERKYATSELIQANNELADLRLKLKDADVSLAVEKRLVDKIKKLHPDVSADEYAKLAKSQSQHIQAIEDDIYAIGQKINIEQGRIKDIDQALKN